MIWNLLCFDLIQRNWANWRPKRVSWTTRCTERLCQTHPRYISLVKNFRMHSYARKLYKWSNSKNDSCTIRICDHYSHSWINPSVSARSTILSFLVTLRRTTGYRGVHAFFISTAIFHPRLRCCLAKVKFPEKWLDPCVGRVCHLFAWPLNPIILRSLWKVSKIRERKKQTKIIGKNNPKSKIKNWWFRTQKLQL